MKWVQMETVNLRLLVPSGLTVAAAVGGAVGYVVASKIQAKKFRELADKEIAEARVYYQGLYSRPPLVIDEEDESDIPTTEELKAEGIEGLLRVNGLSEDDVEKAMSAFNRYGVPAQEHEERSLKIIQPEVVNVFANHRPPGEEVLAALMADRNPDEPYIITKSEFFENEPDHEQKAFTYWEGDGVLVDDQDEFNPVPDNNRVAGDDNLLRFGYGSGDEHTLYIRNETVDPPLDLCITRSMGKYTDEVMGFNDDEPHLKHSAPRKFRTYDD